MTIDTPAWVRDAVFYQVFPPDAAFERPELVELLKDYWQQAAGAAVDVAQTVGRGGAVALTVITNLVLIPVVAFYMMRDWDKLISGVQNLLPRSAVGQLSGVAREMKRYIPIMAWTFGAGVLLTIALAVTHWIV